MSTTTYVPCQCGCRPADAPVPCACPECSPGLGLDHDAKRRKTSQGQETRMLLLLHRKTLTDEETSELDGLLDWYIHR